MGKKKINQSPVKTTTLPTHDRQTKLYPSTSNPSPTPTPDQTPKKSKPKNTLKSSPNDQKTRSLYSFFNTATQKQQQQQQSTIPENTPAVPVEQLEDLINDDDSSEDLPNSHTPSRGHLKDSLQSTVPQKRKPDDQPAIISASTKFLKREDSKPTHNEVLVEADLRPWNERYGPSNLGDLLVHKKKVADVQGWLEQALSGRRHFKLLVLKGPAGAGKTTTLSLLCKSLATNLVEWRNPTSMDYLSDSALSASAQFEEFLGRGSAFGGLDIVSDEATSKPEHVSDQTKNSEHEQKALLIEEFPNNLARSSKVLQSFRSAVLQYLETPTKKPTPLIMIISETTVSDTNSSLDNFTAYRLLGHDLLHHPSSAVVEFNPVAATFIKKALKLVLQKRRRDVGAHYEPSEDVLTKLSEFGDVRNAVSTLEFICSQTHDKIVPNAAPNVAKNSRSKTSKAVTRDQKKSPASEDLSLIALRESSIGLFHAAGRVLYNKRSTPPGSLSSTETNAESSMPPHLSKSGKRLPSEVDPDTLIDETGTDVQTFLSSLHENYLLSCFSPDGNGEATLDSVTGCIEMLADADILSNTFSGSSYSSGISGLRQSELAFQTAVRGILHNLPYPVKRQPPPGRGKADAFRMFYSTYLKLSSQREEQKDLLDLLADKAIKESLNIRPARTSASNASHSDAKDTSEDGRPGQVRTIVGSGHSARQEMLIERLPYMAHMLSYQTAKPSQRILTQIEQVTKFTGIDIVQDEEEEPEESSVSKTTSAAARRSTSQQSSISSLFQAKQPNKSSSGDDLEIEEKLVLSDDDIEDD